MGAVALNMSAWETIFRPDDINDIMHISSSKIISQCILIKYPGQICIKVRQKILTGIRMLWPDL